MRKKELLAGGYIRDLLFRNPDDAQLYIYELDHRGVAYKILDSFVRDGSVIIRILQQYNNSPLIEL